MHPLVVIGASAGGLRALTAVLAALPTQFHAPVVVAQHHQPQRASLLGTILAPKVKLRVVEVSPGSVLESGTIHVAPSGHDVSVASDGRLSLGTCTGLPIGCPSIDRLFTSAAAARGTAVIAVVLSGTGRDGAQGVVAVGRTGGTVIIERDQTALFEEMPQAAAGTGTADAVLPVHEIGPALVELSRPGRGAA